MSVPAPRARLSPLLATTMPPATPPPAPALLFDGDNTLWRCTEFYREANEGLLTWLAARFPALAREQITQWFHAIDLAGAAQPDGFRLARYPESMRATYHRCCEALGVVPDPMEADACAARAWAVYEADYTPFPGVPALLGAYRAAGYVLGLVTKGDVALQKQKIARAGLETHFQVTRVSLTKTREELAMAAALLTSAAPRPIVVIGDSLRDEIAHGQALGHPTVWVRGGSPKAWRFDDEGVAHVRPTVTIADVTELATLLPPRPRSTWTPDEVAQATVLLTGAR